MTETKPGQLKAQLMDSAAMQRAVNRMAHEIIERLEPLENVLLVGIRRRGVPLARRLADTISRYEGVTVPVGEVDITLYRDDLSSISDQPRVGGATPRGRDRPHPWYWWTMCFTQAVRPGPPWRRSWTRDGRTASSWRCWWTAGTVNCRSGLILWARISRPRTPNAWG